MKKSLNPWAEGFVFIAACAVAGMWTGIVFCSVTNFCN